MHKVVDCRCVSLRRGFAVAQVEESIVWINKVGSVQLAVLKLPEQKVCSCVFVVKCLVRLGGD